MTLASATAPWYLGSKRKVYFLRVAGVQPVTRRKMELGKEEQQREYKRLLERKDLFGVPREEIRDVVPRRFVSSSRLRLKGIIDILLLLKDGDAGFLFF